MDEIPLQSQENNNNPSAERWHRRFFGSDMLLVPEPEDDETYLNDFSKKDALRLNKMNKPNPVAVERAQPRARPIVRAVLLILRRGPAKTSTRIYNGIHIYIRQFAILYLE
jgi:hypothetical protein